MVNRKPWRTTLSALGITLSLLGVSHAAQAGVVVELNITKDFYGGYNAKIELDEQAKAMLSSNPELSFSLGHAVKSLYGAKVLSNSADIIRLSDLHPRSIGYTDKATTSDKLSATNCTFAGQSCEIRITGKGVSTPTATPTKAATATPTATKVATFHGPALLTSKDGVVEAHKSGSYDTVRGIMYVQGRSRINNGKQIIAKANKLFSICFLITFLF